MQFSREPFTSARRHGDYQIARWPRPSFTGKQAAAVPDLLDCPRETRLDGGRAQASPRKLLARHISPRQLVRRRGGTGRPPRSPSRGPRSPVVPRLAGKLCVAGPHFSVTQGPTSLGEVLVRRGGFRITADALLPCSARLRGCPSVGWSRTA